MKKRFISIILALIVLSSALPLSVFAAVDVDINSAGRHGVISGAYNGYDLVRGIFSYNDSYGLENDMDAVYYYSDGYFAQRPENYNSSLATMSLCLAMSASVADNYGNDEYTCKFANVKQLLADIGCVDNSTFISEEYMEDAGLDTIGTVISKKTIVLEGGENFVLIPVVIRSSGDISELANSLTLGSRTTIEHKGFANSAEKVIRYVEKYILNNSLNGELAAGRVKFWITGESRGGAVANIAAKRLTDLYGEKNVIYCYDFEAPAGGYNSDENSKIYYNIHNIINDIDIIAKLAPYEMGFVRYGVDHYVPGNPEIKEIKILNRTYNIGKDDETVRIVYDNISWTPSMASDYYNSQREKMLVQLSAVDPSFNYNDSFKKAELIPSADYKLGDENLYEVSGILPNVSTFENDFISKFISYSFAGTEYNGKISRKYDDPRMFYSKENAYNNNYVSLESALRIIINLYTSKEKQEREDILNILISKWDNMPYDDKNSICTEVIDNWYNLSYDEQMKWLTVLWRRLILPDGETECVGDHFTTSELTSLRSAWPALCSVLLQFASYDKSDGKLDLTGTLLYNIESFLQMHSPKLCLAWLRSYDVNYETESSAYVLNRKDAAVSSPTATLINSETGSVETANEFWGDHMLILNSDSGSAIYYTVKVDVNGISATSDKMLYTDKIDLKQKGNGTKYTITAYSQRFGTVSEEASFEYVLKADIVEKSWTDDPDTVLLVSSVIIIALGALAAGLIVILKNRKYRR